MMVEILFAQAAPATPEPASIAVWLIIGAAATAFGVWGWRRKR